MSVIDGTEGGDSLAHARLPSNSGRRSVQLRLREIHKRGDDGALLIEVVVKGQMFERGKSGGGDLVPDFEWVFPQVLISSKRLRELHASIGRCLVQIEPFALCLGIEGCVFDFELSHRPDVSSRRDLPACALVCGMGGVRAECAFAVDHSCLLELADGLERISARIA